MGRRLEVTVSSQEEGWLQPSEPYAPSEARLASVAPSHVITVVAPSNPLRYPK